MKRTHGGCEVIRRAAQGLAGLVVWPLSASPSSVPLLFSLPTSPMNPTAITTLIEGNRYNPDILGELQTYLQHQIDTNTYHFEANLAILKLYQFHPAKADKTVIAKILIKALTNLPNTHFLLCSYLINERLVSFLFCYYCYNYCFIIFDILNSINYLNVYLNPIVIILFPQCFHLILHLTGYISSFSLFLSHSLP